MSVTLTAQDLWPLVQKLPHEEQLRLARLALREVARDGRADAVAYQEVPPAENEFSSDDDPLAWEAGGWEEFDAPR
jgi:hypothetical protein